ncbi:MAG: glycerol-3-phosphate dehydrogenase/oxidase [Chloroflexi bacterium]|nr:MAG: glycerol-3-phosphate dehydrogenase/oxidase [Chloroflexota bacterium]
MDRNLNLLASTEYDLLIIGGGIYGAALAWDAARRGLHTALVEKADFCGATSANSLKVIHGGLRYLQHADVRRARQSICERKTLLNIAPHLVHPLPVLLPTYGHGLKGREIFALGLALNDVIGLDRNKNMDPQKHLPAGQTISRQECLRRLPGLDPNGVTGGALFYDAQVYNSERLVLAFLHSATEAGAEVANYVQANGFDIRGDAVTGVHVTDTLTGQAFTIRAKQVVNSAGPWVNHLLAQTGYALPAGPVQFATAVNLVTRQLLGDTAVGVSGRRRFTDADSVINKGSRFFFIAPWRHTSLVGTGYAPYHGHPDDFTVTAADISTLLADVNAAWPGANLSPEDIYFVHGGLVPMQSYHSATGSVQLTKHARIDNFAQVGLRGLLSVVGVKYTTARRVAAQVVDLLFKQRGQTPPPSDTHRTPVFGGNIERFDPYLADQIRRRPEGLVPAQVELLVRNYGTAYVQLLEQYRPRRGEDTALALLRAQTIYAVRREMAQSLGDVVFRRTELGSAGHPGSQALHVCAQTLARELGWTPEKIESELAQVAGVFGRIPVASNPTDAENYEISTSVARPAV